MSKNSFLRSVLTVSSGTVVAQVVAILFQPVISRLYTPEDMGILANFVAITTILSVIASGSYESAVVLPENKKEANAVVFAGFSIAFLFGTFCTLICVLFKTQVMDLLALNNIPPIWFYLIGLYVAIIGIDNVLHRYAIRNAHYKIIAQTQVTQQIGNNVVKTVLGFVSKGPVGLFIGTVFSQIARACRLLLGERKSLFEKSNFPNVNDIVITIKRYKKFPLVTSWSVLLNSVSVQLPVIMITKLFSSETSGAYAMANRMLNLPMVLIGASVANVFLQKSAEVRSDIQNLQKLTNEIYRKLLLLGALCMSTVCFWGDRLFPFVLGSNWGTAGVFSQRLSFWLLFVLATSPLSQIYTVLERQGEGLFMNIVLFVSRIVVILFCYYSGVDSLGMITAYSAISMALWFFQCVRIMTILKYPLHKFLAETMLILLPVYGLQFGFFMLLTTLIGE